MTEPAGAGAVRKFARDRVLTALPFEPAEAVTLTTIACRCDMAHHAVRHQLRNLMAGFLVVEVLRAGGARYHRLTEEEAMAKRQQTNAPLGARILAELPVDKINDNGPTIQQLAGELSVRGNAISAELAELIDAGQVVRRGAGKRGDPYRHYRPHPPAPAEAPDELAAATEGDSGSEAEPAARAAENAETEAAERPVSPDLPSTDTPTPSDSGPDELQQRREATPAELAETWGPAAYGIVAADLRARADEARHDAAVLEAAAELAERIAAELAP